MQKSRRARAMIAGIVGLLMAVSTAAPANASGPENGAGNGGAAVQVEAAVGVAAVYPMFRNRWNGRCLDADLNTITRNGTRVQMWDCNGQNQQRWFQGSEAVIRNYASARCLDADLNTIGRNGTRIQLWDCNFQNQQKFYLQGLNFRIAYNGRCLDVDTTQNWNGGRVQLWDCNGAPQQQWDLIY